MYFLTFDQFCTEFNAPSPKNYCLSEDDYQPDLSMIYYEYMSELQERNEAECNKWLEELPAYEQFCHLSMMIERSALATKNAFQSMGAVDTSNFSESQKKVHQESLNEHRQLVLALLENDLNL